MYIPVSPRSAPCTQVARFGFANERTQRESPAMPGFFDSTINRGLSLIAI
jgi:hypothetical protein